MTDRDYTNKSQQRMASALWALLEHGARGAAPHRLAEDLNVPRGVITRDLFNLREARMTERTAEGNRYRISAELAKKTLLILRDIDRMEEEVSRLRDRYTDIGDA
uniref:IclR helix-turn-helix domain-containing protein n=1 Tax=Candidatus Kentrum sp. TC TaxID=2126339 RepID=A0A450YYK2_9GAMM|nr:MAG: hypothetical protein BECKTC1821E_GA0114239_106714 [Candidatus Kentron sp. TC]